MGRGRSKEKSDGQLAGVAEIDSNLRGLYTRNGSAVGFERQVVLACNRVPRGIVWLKSALGWHGILPPDSRQIWMAIDRKAKKPVVDGLRLRFVRVSGEALTQGVVNIRIHGVPVRVYSVAKTLADCLKYRRKIGVKLSTVALSKSIAQMKCSKERLRHFAKMRRVERLI